MKAFSPLLQRFLTHLGWKTLAELGTRVIGLLFFIWLARQLGDADYGRYTYPLALAALWAVLLDGGQNALMIRDLGRQDFASGPFLRRVLGIKVIASCLFLSFFSVSCWLTDYSIPLSWLVAAAVFVLGQAWLDSLAAALNSQHLFQLEARLKIMQRLLLLIPQALVLIFSPQIPLLLGVAAIAQSATVLFAWLLARSALASSEKLAIETESAVPSYGYLLRTGLGFWLANIAWLLYLKVDLVMLPLLGRPLVELGWYQAAIRSYEIFALVGYLVSAALFPLVAARFKHNRPPRSLLLKRWSQLGLLALGLGAVAHLLAPDLLVWALGQSYQPAGQSLAILTLSIPFVFMNQIGFNLLAALNRQGSVAIATSLCLALNICLNSFWIPVSGQFGAAWSTVLADILLWLLISYYLLSQNSPDRPANQQSVAQA